MTIKGDLQTLELGDVLQNLAARRATGVLRVAEPDGTSSALYLAGGDVALLARDDRPSLMDVLVLAGELSEAELEKVKKKRRRTKKSLGQVLVELKFATDESLSDFAQTRLVAEACEVLAIQSGEFEFTDGPVPRSTFDAEERRLKLRVAVGPLLLETARRSDHWREIRHILPHDGAYLGRLTGVKSSDDDLTRELLGAIDGTVTIAELVAQFPHLRFQAYQALANLVRSGRAARLDANALVKLAEAQSGRDLVRAKECVDRGLREFPNHLELLALRVSLSQDLGELDDAVESLKLRVHTELGQGDLEGALRDLAHARELAPTDATLVERAFELSLEAGNQEAALAEGRRWVELLREPGLHRRAAEVLERLVSIAPDDRDLRVELAKSHADCGAVGEARLLLEAAFEAALRRDEDDDAAHFLRALLAIDPQHERAGAALAELEDGTLERQRSARRRRRRLVFTSVALALLSTFGVFEWSARRSFREATRVISESGWIEAGRYRDAADHYRVVRANYPWTLTGLVDVEAAVRELERKARAERRASR